MSGWNCANKSDGRVFPCSDKAVDIVDALKKHVNSNGAELIHGRCTSLILQNGKVNGIKLEDGTSINADSVIIATGGLSYPATGSSGDGYTLAKN
ncbi:MAG: NAD(P)/FAD-dependent oxidoreductase, partial [Hydrogenoanaerobacterium sp.]